eukprot:22112-Eustigmatos_ZCMA.PRE.1
MSPTHAPGAACALALGAASAPSNVCRDTSSSCPSLTPSSPPPNGTKSEVADSGVVAVVVAPDGTL